VEYSNAPLTETGSVLQEEHSCILKARYLSDIGQKQLSLPTKRKRMIKKDAIHPYGEKQDQFDRRYLRMAAVWSENSYCQRRKVGALIVKDKMIISDGYNGTPAGFENVCEDENNVTKPYVLHAEANAITKVARSNNSSENATLYITDSPCMECSKLIIQSGIKRVVYSNQYRNLDGIELLKRAAIELVYIDLGEKKNEI
jgi:dCMP deaminase